MSITADTTWVYDDGGREAAGFRGSARDCGVRAIAIATGMDYQEVYDRVNDLAKRERPRSGKTRSSSRNGVHRQVVDWFMEEIGWEWVPCMEIGSGCRVHVRADELPEGPLVLRLSRHFAAWVGGRVRDTHDCTRDGTRCVYGYYRPGDAGEEE